MKPIVVSVTVPRPRTEVFDFLDVTANHAPFLDHMWTDFSFSGPERGVGSALRARALAPGREDWTEVEVVYAEPPKKIVERGSGAGGRRRTQGTYSLEERTDGGTEVRFQLELLAVPPVERIAGPLMRAYLRKLLSKAMVRLREQVTSGPQGALSSSTRTGEAGTASSSP